ncbi:hypothetical protein TUN199_10423 [Pyrenophora tritici-repentis]|nr:hypothetical protein Alg215_10463 [Pyrenophora tritici-repentis]KAI0617589.1 hypothetical protein TUN199_10423 [Pyrenophora tritici-repentis]KAI1525464.1 hypothetical protein PtrSN001C_010625 [Pyrenophora tritici-repentis]KAI1594770.1 hypothetical protein PtrCC142_010740 [Pyrenophora tritici-repentis]PZC89313.1 hypothetical protein A1F95_10390 [Pyrenophora tritici-repentis]
MTLLTTPTLIQLYNNILQLNAHEHHSKTFWTHLLRTQFFPEEDFVIATESPPTPLPDDSLRRVDFHISIFNRTQKLQIIAICEIKKATGSIDEVEAQLQQACQACVTYTKADVWGIAVVGTKAQILHYTMQNSFYPLTNGYVDANSSEANTLRNTLLSIKTVIKNQTASSSATPDGCT